MICMATNPSNPPHDDLPPGTPPLAADAPDISTAAAMIRDKVARLYDDEPDAGQAAAEVAQMPQRSKHQQFMYELGASGKDLAAIQTAWHNYYQSLPAPEKHQVWQEW
jgi:hypothetical protein